MRQQLWWLDRERNGHGVTDPEAKAE